MLAAFSVLDVNNALSYRCIFNSWHFKIHSASQNCESDYLFSSLVYFHTHVLKGLHRRTENQDLRQFFVMDCCLLCDDIVSGVVGKKGTDLNLRLIVWSWQLSEADFWLTLVGLVDGCCYLVTSLKNTSLRGEIWDICECGRTFYSWSSHSHRSLKYFKFSV